ncbi:hypothetical protein CcaverHIS002_0705870 [Cutaneotrichosporon cavernicola]|nr:hypothetical protein CcaverHIS002_0705870 [Cutaneotrichosporon cavernicola]BEJ10537.1 hypothetical protein CcaverHIS641_0705720 [Cutaneotrichosporon cavernicola]
MSATTPNAASSSKRPASASAHTPAAKRARSMPDDDHEEDEELNEVDPSEQNISEEEVAKKARREARTIRNRESAQRSRNQRKAHLAWLETRVVELEAENRALRTGSAPSSPSKTRESSPAHSVLSLASDLGIPSEIVTAGCGVSLATVLPPPADALTDMKPNMEALAPATPTPAPPQDLMQSPMAMAPSNPAELYAQNEHLRWRVNMLENIVRQAANIFSSCPTGNANPASFLPALILPQPQSHPGMEATLSPPLYPSEPHQVASPLHLQSQLDAPHPNHNQAVASGDAGQSYLGLAGHPAAAVGRGAGDRGAGSASGLDLGLPTSSLFDGNNVVSAQVGGTAQGAWFEITEAAAFDDSEMRGLDDLLAELEAKQPEQAGANATSVLTESAPGVNEWAWATKAVVDLQ